MDEYIIKDGKHLRFGHTTGSCAAAAAKAAAIMLLTGRRKEEIVLTTPKGISLTLPVREIVLGPDAVSCAVEKDGGDDPDVTTGTLIFAAVSLTDAPGVIIDGGAGVGRVTKPGLDQPIGAAAINSVPRRMIRENVEEVCRALDYEGGLSVVISVPGGEDLAKKTFNPRLGIVGGISILGTTGIVEPMSERAMTEALHVALRQRRALGADYLLLTPGNYGAEFTRDVLGLPPEKAVLTSNFIGDALDFCRALGFRGVLLVGHTGKLVKLAGGMWNTHSRYGDCRMEILAAHAGAAGLDAAHIAALLESVTTDEAIRILDEAELREATLRSLTDKIARELTRKAEGMEIGAILFSRTYGLLSETENARKLLGKL